MAKKTGMRVDEFAIGFPPRLFSIKRGETEYSINLIPIGGYVRIFGENLETAKDTLDQPRSFAARPRYAQALVLIAGVTMNVIFAWFLFVTTYLIGVPTAVDEAVASPQAALHIAGVLPGSPLGEKIPAGAQVVALSTSDETLETLTPSAFSAFVQANSAEALTITYLDNDVEKTVTVTPMVGLLPEAMETPAVGVSLALVENVRESFWGAIVMGTEATISGLINITVGLYNLLSAAVVGEADFSQVAGPVGIVSLVGDAAAYGITSLLMFTAIISLNLAIINLLPIPALDGGRLLFVAIEAVIKRPINIIWATRLNLVGFALLMLLMVVVTWNDIARLL